MCEFVCVRGLRGLNAGPAPTPQFSIIDLHSPRKMLIAFNSTRNYPHPLLNTKYSDILNCNNSQVAALATRHVNPPLVDQYAEFCTGLNAGPAPHQPTLTTRTNKYSDILTRKNPLLSTRPAETSSVCVFVCLSVVRIK